jgi:predicted nucleotidyltransferase component of viral defense system
MILQKEISTIAEAKQVSKSTIDKDWGLGHFLAAIYSEPELKKTLVFKGGTCLKKCYFPDYRFSEDLDFTSREKKFELSKKHVQFICEYLKKNAEILTHIDSIRPLKFKDELTGYEAVVRFWGADHSRNETPPPPDRWHTRIKIEIILYELLTFDEVRKAVTHTYSDTLALDPNEIPCYSIEEVLAEKLRALIQRSYTAPRDFYDIWYLNKHYPDLDFTKIVEAFHKKMKFKNLEFKGIEQLMDEDDDKKLRASWKNSLAHQIQTEALPEFDTVKNELTNLFSTIFKRI